MAGLRAVGPADWGALNRLHAWAWFPERSEAGWAWLRAMGKSVPGWVLEDGEGVCGFLGNIRQDYAQGPERLIAATGYSLIVLPRARGGSRVLLDAFRSQPGIFAASIFNGNARSAPIYQREGFTPFPDTWANAKIVWPLAPLTILSERIARARFQNRRSPRELFSASPGGALTSGTKQLAALDPWTDAALLDAFYAVLQRSGSTIADRSAGALQNRFSDPDRTAAPVLCGWREDGRLSAIVLGQMGKMTECEAPILDVIDVAWVGPHGDRAAAALLSHMRTLGRRLSASRMRLSLVNSATAAVARQVPGGLVRRRHVHAHICLPGPQEHDLLWSPTPYDGDFAFCLRAPPVLGQLVSMTQDLRSQGLSGRPSTALAQPAA